MTSDINGYRWMDIGLSVNQTLAVMLFRCMEEKIKEEKQEENGNLVLGREKRFI